MKSRKRLNRRDLCHAIGTRAHNLSLKQGGLAWLYLSNGLLALSDPERPATPKFRDLIEMIRAATIIGRKHGRP